MAYDEELANRVRERLAGEPGISETSMFGGLAFLVAGNMAVAVTSGDELMVRLGAEGADEALAQPHVEQVVMRGRPMTGWVKVAAAGLAADDALAGWVERGRVFAETLPPKR